MRPYSVLLMLALVSTAHADDSKAASRVAAVATLKAPARGRAGCSLEVLWTGPCDATATLVLAEPSAPPEQRIFAIDLLGTSDSTTLRLPIKPGTYEVRYVLADREVLARQLVKVLPVVATLQAPSQVRAGSGFEIEWTGPDCARAAITLANPAWAPAAKYMASAAKGAGGTVQARAPRKPGRYELRFVLESTEVLARQTIDVLPP